MFIIFNYIHSIRTDRAAPWVFPRASPSGDPSEQPCQPLENPVYPSSFTWINPLLPKQGEEVKTIIAVGKRGQDLALTQAILDCEGKRSFSAPADITELVHVHEDEGGPIGGPGWGLNKGGDLMSLTPKCDILLESPWANQTEMLEK